MNNGAFGVVTSATATAMTVTFSTKPAAGGSLTAIVTTGTIASAAAVQIAKVIPVVNANAGLSLNANASSIVINGIGFDTTASNNTVTFNNGANWYCQCGLCYSLDCHTRYQANIGR